MLTVLESPAGAPSSSPSEAPTDSPATPAPVRRGPSKDDLLSHLTQTDPVVGSDTFSRSDTRAIRNANNRSCPGDQDPTMFIMEVSLPFCWTTWAVKWSGLGSPYAFFFR